MATTRPRSPPGWPSTSPTSRSSSFFWSARARTGPLWPADREISATARTLLHLDLFSFADIPSQGCGMLRGYLEAMMKHLVVAFMLFAGASPAFAQIHGSSAGELKVDTVASGLVHPWALQFLPDRRMLVTERPGRMRI